MPTHTPGPWHRNIPPARKYPTIFSGRNTHVAVLAVRGGCTLSDEELEANCDLIAAAPELLEALETIEAFASNKSVLGSWTNTLEIARAAIQKARQGVRR